MTYPRTLGRPPTKAVLAYAAEHGLHTSAGVLREVGIESRNTRTILKGLEDSWGLSPVVKDGHRLYRAEDVQSALSCRERRESPRGPIGTCAACRGPIPYTGKPGRPGVCSRRCKRARWRTAQRQAYAAAKAQRPSLRCIVCEQPLPAGHHGHLRAHKGECATEMRRRAQRVRRDASRARLAPSR